MRNLGLLVLVVFWLFVSAEGIEAKVLPQAQQSSGKSITSKNVSVVGIGIYPRLRADRRALMVYFANLQNAREVSYLLRYRTSIQDEAAMGGLNLSGLTSQTSEILFGTCSKNVCTYHSGIKDAKLEISYTTKAGRKFLKKYRINI